ncbi:hypothetical protein ALO43_200120 [Pseudomonas tremae]|uniref:Uncharacterized protein n=1 Tax=Pseudomonas tremae TaxID=200454 RepID=A0AA40P136_9PSED|nr:hypothetical protein ALO43_200120 [Pseudomonas tremae]
MTSAVNVQKTIRMVRFPSRGVVNVPSLIITVLIKPISIASTTDIRTWANIKPAMAETHPQKYCRV